MYEPGNDILVLPAKLVAQAADGAVLAAGLEAEDAEGLGNDHALDVVVGRGNTVKGLEALHGSGAAGGLVRDHAPDGAPEHLGGSAEVEGAWQFFPSVFAFEASGRSKGAGTNHRGWGCSGSACAGRPSTSLLLLIRVSSKSS